MAGQRTVAIPDLIAAALVFRVQRGEPVSVEVADHIRTRSWPVNATAATAATPMPWADSSTICARRQVTTDPRARRMIRASQMPALTLG